MILLTFVRFQKVKVRLIPSARRLCFLSQEARHSLEMVGS